MKKKVKKGKKPKKTVKRIKKVLKKKVVKKIKKRESKKTAPLVTIKPAGKKIGAVTHYYGKIGVGIVKFSKPVSSGASIRFIGATTDFSQTIDSMQFDHKEIVAAGAGQEVGMKVKHKVREGDEIFIN